MNELTALRQALTAKLLELNAAVCAIEFDSLDAQVLCAQMNGVQSAIDKTDAQMEAILREAA